MSQWSRPTKTTGAFQSTSFSANIPVDQFGFPYNFEWEYDDDQFFAPPSTNTEYTAEFDIPQALVD